MAHSTGHFDHGQQTRDGCLQSLIIRVDQLVNTDLREVCKEEGLTVSGRKALLQERIKTRAKSYHTLRDDKSLQLLQFRVHNPQHIAKGIHIPTFSPFDNGPLSTSLPGIQVGFAFQPPVHTPISFPSMPGPRAPVTFKKSPFYDLQRMLGHTKLQMCPSHRTSVSLNFQIQSHEADQLRTQGCILLFAAEAPSSASGHDNVDIVFPQQIEIKVNGNEVKGNTRGVKGKKGSTKPLDITQFVRSHPKDRKNNISIQYALTSKDDLEKNQPQIFHVIAYFATKTSVENLKARVGTRVIPKSSVLADMRTKAKDTDIVATSMIMSLKDPVSYTRIQTPCRGTTCHHVRCFDLETYLQMQEQAPIWECPICNKPASLDNLAVDEYIREILAVTKDVDQVTIEPDGRWSKETASSKRSNGAYNDDDDSDDLIEIPPPYASKVKREAPATPVSMFSPHSQGDSASRQPSSQHRGQKRPSEVIDLTLSDDDEPAPKRVAFSASNGATAGKQGNASQVHPNRPPPSSGSNAYTLSFRLPDASTNLHSGTGHFGRDGSQPHLNTWSGFGNYHQPQTGFDTFGTGDGSRRGSSSILSRSPSATNFTNGFHQHQQGGSYGNPQSPYGQHNPN